MSVWLERSNYQVLGLTSVVGCAGLGLLAAYAPSLALAALAIFTFAVFGPILRAHAFESAVSLMLLALPLYSTSVLNLGVTVRLSYLFGGAALILGCLGRRPALGSARSTWALLMLFLLVVLASVAFNPVVPAVPPLTASGWRGVPGLRPLLQCAQLLFMAGVMWVTAAYCRTRERVAAASTLIVIGGLFAIGYAFYVFIASYAGLPRVDINNAMNTDFSFGYKPQDNSYLGGTIPRPRSTFPEPQNFANFLLLVIPLMFVQLISARTSAKRRAWAVLVGLTLLLFIFAVNSRGAVIGGVIGFSSMALFARDRGDLVRWTIRSIAWATALGLVAAVLVEVLYVGGAWAFMGYMSSRLGSALGGTNRVTSEWQMVWSVFLRHRFVGVGFGNLTYYIGQFEGTPLKGVTDAGGVYQRLLAELGIGGLLLYLVFLGSVLFKLLKVGRRRGRLDDGLYARALFFAIVADAVQRVATVGLATDAHLWVALGLAIGVVQLADTPRAASLSAVNA